MNAYSPQKFFSLADYQHAALFVDGESVWRALGDVLDEYLRNWTRWETLTPLAPSVHVLGGPIFIGEGCEIEPGAVLRGPLVVGSGCQIRTGAYVRGHVVLGNGCVVGAHTEVKRAIFLDGAHAPHQNYVGDSILGRRVNLGAGTILSNVKNIGGEVSFHHAGKAIQTGLRKFGAVLGDGCRTGCNTVLNPGVLMGPACMTYPNVALRAGYYPPNTVIKLRQVQEQTSLGEPGSE